MKEPIIKEAALHVQIAAYLNLALDPKRTLWTTIENSNQQGGCRGKRNQAELKKKGVKAGIPDILIMYVDIDAHVFSVLFLEIKRPKYGVVSIIQKNMHDSIVKIGGNVAVVKSIEDIIEAMIEYRVPFKDLAVI